MLDEVRSLYFNVDVYIKALSSIMLDEVQFKPFAYNIPKKEEVGNQVHSV